MMIFKVAILAKVCFMSRNAFFNRAIVMSFELLNKLIELIKIFIPFILMFCLDVTVRESSLKYPKIKNALFILSIVKKSIFLHLIYRCESALKFSKMRESHLLLGIVKSEVRQSHSIFLRMFFENIQPVTRHYGAPWGAY
ncbi:MAG: hypothetical protein GY821_18085 [Gammaproteobacteria bacterium]|nr:hypothetical protein [Gammaproteobacteria bacterium]